MCGICGQLFGHDPRCPDYDSRDGAVYICQKCGEGIHSGEKILESDGKKLCSDCVDDLSHEELLEFVGVPMRTVDAEELSDI